MYSQSRTLRNVRARIDKDPIQLRFKALFLYVTAILISLIFSVVVLNLNVGIALICAVALIFAYALAKVLIDERNNPK